VTLHQADRTPGTVIQSVSVSAKRKGAKSRSAERGAGFGGLPWSALALSDGMLGGEKDFELARRDHHLSLGASPFRRFLYHSTCSVVHLRQKRIIQIPQRRRLIPRQPPRHQNGDRSLLGIELRTT
jgi:hypothetical protein